MNSGFEIIEFSWQGMTLQEPMALLTNWMIAAFSFYAYAQLKKGVSLFQDLWKSFYMVLGIGMIFGGLGHLFFQYFSFYGKFPSWTLGVLAGILASFAMIETVDKEASKKLLQRIVLIKSVILLSLSFVTLKFLFVALDTSVTYLLFCGFLAYRQSKKEWRGISYFYYGVLALLPSAFIFGLKFNMHKWLNKDDLSHIFILACVMLFFVGVKSTQKLMPNRLR
ncbi:MAG: hypothetical protein QNL60_03480 [Flavobacteriales bacterium]|jgi:hypothetical protein|nr:hypothetical protein [Crocinitomicaceae bacterium]